MRLVSKSVLHELSAVLIYKRANLMSFVAKCCRLTVPSLLAKTAKLYFIKPPMPGEEPTIYLMKKPMWFQGFVPREAG